MNRENLEGEIWMPFPKWEDFYEISNKGRVFGLPRIVYAKNGHVYHLKGGLKKLTPNHINKYLMVTLTDKPNKRHETICVHRKVGEVFIPNPNNLPEINHLKTKNDITIDDLEWSTSSDNHKHAYRTGLMRAKKGVDCKFSRRVASYLGDVLVREYDFVRQAEVEGFNEVGIFQSIKLGCKHQGFNWKYLEDRKWERRKSLKSVVPICRYKNGEIDKVFVTRQSLLDEGYWVDNIYKCLKGQLKTYKGYTWRYLEKKAA